MPVFKKNKLVQIGKSQESADTLTKRTVILGLTTLVIFILVLAVGLPLLIRFSVFLGENRKNQNIKEVQSLPPTPPRIVMPFEATPSASIDIVGFAEKGGSVELYKDGKKFLTKQTNEEGEFNFSKVDLNSGPNTFWAVVFLKESIKSEPSKKVIVIRDETAPILDLVNPSEEKLTVDVADFDVIGKTEPGVSVTINNYVASVNDKGEFKLKLQLSPGKNEYEVKAKDMAGNIAKKKITITYDI